MTAANMRIWEDAGSKEEMRPRKKTKKKKKKEDHDTRPPIVDN
jgi:hypothetical protein